jgi:hypothetical protein
MRRVTAVPRWLPWELARAPGVLYNVLLFLLLVFCFRAALTVTVLWSVGDHTEGTVVAGITRCGIEPLSQTTVTFSVRSMERTPRVPPDIQDESKLCPVDSTCSLSVRFYEFVNICPGMPNAELGSRPIVQLVKQAH